MKRQTDFSNFCPDCRRQYDAARTICPRDGARLAEVPFVLPRAGAVFDSRYVILETIGKGGMATIYRGYDIEKRRQCALKVLKSKFSSEERAVSQFFTEARVARRLQHSNIIRTFDYGRTDVGYLYIAMELLKGEPLSRVIRREGRLSPCRALSLFAQMMDALEAAHAKGTIHRDLKPENIFVFQQGGRERVKLLDFGIAQLAGTVALGGGEICGTPAYMSPEQIRGRKATPASDLYSAAIVLFEMLAGRQPFTGASHLEILKRQLKMAPPELADVRDDLADETALQVLLARLLRKKPADRLGTAGDVKDFLVRIGIPREPRVILPAPATEVGLEGEGDNPPVFSFDAREADEEDALPVVQPPRTAPQPAITLKEPARIQFDPEAAPAAEPALEPPPPPGDPACMAERYSLLHVRFVPLDGNRDDLARTEALREQLNDHLDDWFAFVHELGGLMVYDAGTELKVLFGYLTESTDHAVLALLSARALSLRVEHRGLRRGLRCGVKMGVATGVVYTDQNVEGPLDWLIKGSEIDFAVRLSRLAPVGGVVLCQHTAMRSQPRAVMHEMARVAARGGKALATFLLRDLDAAGLPTMPADNGLCTTETQRAQREEEMILTPDS